MRRVFFAIALALACSGGRSLQVADGSADAASDVAADAVPDLADDARDPALDLPADPGGRGILAITPPSHDFGPISLGSTSDRFFFLFSNVGDGPVSTCQQGEDGKDFTVAKADSTCLGMDMLPAGASCTFAPTSAGVKSATLIVSTAEGGMGAASLTGLAM